MNKGEGSVEFDSLGAEEPWKNEQMLCDRRELNSCNDNSIRSEAS